MFTFHTKNKKIQMSYFWDNDHWNDLWKGTREITDSFFQGEEDEEEPFFGETAERELSEMKELPPMNIERILEEYETSYVSGRFSELYFDVHLFDVFVKLITFPPSYLQRS